MSSPDIHTKFADALREHEIGYEPERGHVCVSITCDWWGHYLDFPEHQTDVLLATLAQHVAEGSDD